MIRPVQPPGNPLQQQQQVIDMGKHHRDHQPAQPRRSQQASNYRNRHRRAGTRLGTDSQRDRRHAMLAPGHHRVLDEQDGVLGDDADQHQQAEEGAADRQRQRGEDGRRLEEVVEEGWSGDTISAPAPGLSRSDPCS